MASNQVKDGLGLASTTAEQEDRGNVINNLDKDQTHSVRDTKKPYQPKRMSSLCSQNSVNIDHQVHAEEIASQKLIPSMIKSFKKTMLEKCRSTTEGLRMTKSCDVEEVDAILARKMSSLDMDRPRLKRQESSGTLTEEELSWRTVGTVEILRKTRCRRLYAKSGEEKDLALFYRSGTFFAMSAWCSHMGKLCS